jgi:hypothetical protein
LINIANIAKRHTSVYAIWCRHYVSPHEEPAATNESDPVTLDKRTVGTIVLLVLGIGSAFLYVFAYVHSIQSPNMLAFYAAVAAFGLYAFGAVFFDYAVTFRTTIKPSDSPALRIFQAGVGLAIWGATVWALLKHL